MTAPQSPSRSSRAGVTLGVGLGGFVDGIVLHQIAQWHNMLSSRVPPLTMDAMRLNMRWDGAFHLFTWIVTVIGVAMLLGDGRARRLPENREFAGQLLTGWAGFNLIEGAIDHHLLDIHHVRDLPVHVPLLDWMFLLAGGAGMLAVGLWLARPRRITRG